MKFVILIHIILFTTSGLFGQTNNVNQDIKAHEDTLVSLINSMRIETIYQEKLRKNALIEKQLRKMLRIDESFNYKFDTLAKVMGTIKSPDNAFRLFNWNMELENEEQNYFCLVMKYDKRRDDYIIIELFDKSKFAIEPEFNVYNDKKWYGALYYDIIPVKKGAKTIYTLLGWDGNNMLSNKKIIETMAFQGKDHVKFGFPMFRFEDEKSQRRMIFQYNKKSYMSVKKQIIKKETYIIYDHLSPSTPQMEGMYDWYVTDLSFDAFIFRNGKWEHLKDFDARTGKSKKDKFYNDPRKKK